MVVVFRRSLSVGKHVSGPLDVKRGNKGIQGKRRAGKLRGLQIEGAYGVARFVHASEAGCPTWSSCKSAIQAANENVMITLSRAFQGGLFGCKQVVDW